MHILQAVKKSTGRPYVGTASSRRIMPYVYAGSR